MVIRIKKTRATIKTPIIKATPMVTSSVAIIITVATNRTDTITIKSKIVTVTHLFFPFPGLSGSLCPGLLP
jgi:hypothetical protein